MDKETIISEIMDYMNKGCLDKTPFKKLYIGIASDARDRLFIDHEVDEETDIWIYRTADSDKMAREIEKYFIKKGFDGGPGGGDENTKQIYCFLQNNHTKR